MKRLLLLVLLWMLCAGAQAQGAQRLALLIGNWDYNGNGRYDDDTEAGLQTDLHHPCEDAARVGEALRKVGFGGVDTVCNVDKAQFDSRVADFARKVEALPKGSLVFIYYSGHGTQQYGYVYSLPVLFRLGEQLNTATVNDQVRYLASNAVDVQAMLAKFPERKDIAIYVALDQCRSEAVQKFDAYNDMVDIHAAENVMIHYSTTPGQTSPDQSDFSRLLVQELLKGGDMGSVGARVYGRTLELFRSGKADTYARTHSGYDFGTLRSPAMRLAASSLSPAPAALPPVKDAGAVVRDVRQFHRKSDDPSIDIFWCAGQGERERYATAVGIAEKLAANPAGYGVGRIRVRELKVKQNLHDGFNVWRNLMRFDIEDPKERKLLESISAQFAELGLLPSRGKGNAGKPTPNYVSAFICAGFTGR